MICESLKHTFDAPGFAIHLRSEAFVSGVVFGICAAPEIPMPETWMPWVLSDVHEQPLTNGQVDKLADGLIAQLQWQLSLMRNKQSLLPRACTWSEDRCTRLALQQWLSGLLHAHSQVEATWLNAWDKTSISDGERRLTRCLKCFSVLADSDLALNNLPPAKRNSLRDNLPVLFKQLESLLVDYVSLADELASRLPGQFEMYEKPL